MVNKILRLPEVKSLTGLSRSTVYLRMSEGTCPIPISLGGRAVGWLEKEIQSWIQSRIDESRNSSSSMPRS